MFVIFLCVMVLCVNFGCLFRYGVLFNCCGYFYLSLCLD